MIYIEIKASGKSNDTLLSWTDDSGRIAVAIRREDGSVTMVAIDAYDAIIFGSVVGKMSERAHAAPATAAPEKERAQPAERSALTVDLPQTREGGVEPEVPGAQGSKGAAEH